MSLPPPEHSNLRLLKDNPAALRERLQQDMAQRRENIRVREAALAADRAAIMTRGRAAVARVRAAAPRQGATEMVFKTNHDARIASVGDPSVDDPEIDGPPPNYLTPSHGMYIDWPLVQSWRRALQAAVDARKAKA
jgi:hypothetical protein